MVKRKRTSIGENFHAQTKYRRGQLPSGTGRAVPHFKVYANPLEVASLPKAKQSGGKKMRDIFASTRQQIPEGGRIKQEAISQVLWSTGGFSNSEERIHAQPTLLSGLEVYLIIRQVEGMFAGVYHYNPKEHSLEYLVREEPSLALYDALLNNTDIDACAAIVVYTGIPSRVEDGIQSRAYRYLYLEAGSAAQCAVLAANDVDLAATFRAEFYDDELATLLQIDGEREIPLCVVTLGT